MSISVCAYCRVSTNSQDQANSYENQQLYFNRELSKNPDYTLYKIYADKKTGTSLHREQFDEMLKDAGLDILEVRNDSGHLKYVTMPSNRTPKFKYIWVKNSSRIARNVEISSIFRDLARMGVYVIFLDLNKSTENEADATYIQIFSSFDEGESRQRRERVLFGINEGDEKGIIRTNGKIYGYKYLPKPDNRLEIIENEANVIRLIFTLYSEGKGIRQIINHLDDNKIYTRQGKSFVKNAIRNILDNEKYMGLANNRKYVTGTDLFNKFTSPKRKDDDDYKLVESFKIPQIIEPELYYKCKEILYSKVNHKNQKGIKKPTSKYSGIIFCGNCGSVYTSNVDRGRRFYNCKTKKQKGTKCCNNQNVSEKLIDESIELNFKNSHFHISNLKEEYKKKWYYYAYKIINAKTDNSGIIEAIRKDLLLLEEKLNGLYDLYALKKDNRDMLIKRIDTVEEEITSKREELFKHDLEDGDVKSKLLIIKAKLDELDALPDVFSDVDEYLQHIYMRVSDGMIDIEYKFTEGIMSKDDLNVLGEIINNSELHKQVYEAYIKKQDLVP